MISLGANTFVPITPVWVVGTYDHQGRPNVMTAAWGGICCSKPPCVYVSLRKATYTYGNLLERKAFTVSFPSEEYAKEADYFGLVSGRDSDKFSTTKLTSVKSDLVDAPFVKEFPMILECKVIKIVEIGLHTEFIGEILDAKAHEDVLDKNKLPDIEKMRPLIWGLTNMSYRKVGEPIGKSFSIGKQVIKANRHKKQISQTDNIEKIRWVRKMDACKHEHLSDWETASFNDNCEGMQVKRCKNCGVDVEKREISSDCTKQRF